ncbi:periplasmic heavy metal sensor [Pseudoroseomonas globiformis]|uniref:Periplasmic heavy metal sensor n=1 Tax=Teichococcus globiformis TaxID=2307229 RepID=A0ABV7G6X2_9PROT
MRLSSPMILKGALGASLALNLVLAGVLWWQPAQNPHGPSRMQARIERLLPEADREAFRRAMQAGRAQYEPAHAGLREGFAEIQAALRQQPFDAARLRAAMAAGRTRWGEFSRLYEESLTQALGAISAEGRALVAQDIERGQREHRKDGRRREGQD